MHEIAQAKVNKWKGFFDQADGKSIWQVKKYIANMPTPVIYTRVGWKFRNQRAEGQHAPERLLP